MNITFEMPEATDSIHSDMIIAPCCEVCNCTIDKADRDYYVNVGGAPPDEWPAMHYDCYEQRYVMGQ